MSIVPEAPPNRRSPLSSLTARPRLASAVGAGLLLAGLLWVTPNSLALSTRTILSWDATCVLFIGLVLFSFRNRGVSHMTMRAKAQDEGRHLILALVLTAAVVSLSAIAGELSLAKDEHGLVKGLRVVLAFATVSASWFMVQLIFALHYANEYYSAADDADGLRGGLSFPGGQSPDYWDFVHFSVVIGVASQTADIAFTSKVLRRLGTIHSLIAFTFNTIVLALTINLLAGLF